MHVHRLAQRQVERRARAEPQRQHDQVPGLDPMECDEDGEHHRLREHQRLGQQQPAPAVDAVGDDAGEIAEQQDADVGAERDDAEQPRRAGQPVDEPAHCDLLQPGADHRQPLADEEQPEVAGAQGAERGTHSLHDRLRRD